VAAPLVALRRRVFFKSAAAPVSETESITGQENSFEEIVSRQSYFFYSEVIRLQKKSALNFHRLMLR
jgi:hypothetical protein